MQASDVQRTAALQSLLADPYAAEDLLRSQAWPQFCACLGTMLSDPRPETALAGAAFLEKVLEEARLCDPQSVAELFIALSSHICSSSASQHPGFREQAAGSLPAAQGQPRSPRKVPGCGSRAALSAAAAVNAAPLQLLAEARACKLRLLVKILEALPKVWVCAKAPMMKQLWRFLAPLLHIDARYHIQQAEQCSEAAPDAYRACEQGHADMDGLCTGCEAVESGGVCSLGQDQRSSLQQSNGHSPVLCMDSRKPQLAGREAGHVACLHRGSAPAHASPVKQHAAAHCLQTIQHEPASQTTSADMGAVPQLSPALQTRLAMLRGPLVELSLAQEAPAPHAKSWWQAWTLPMCSTRVRSEAGCVAGLMSGCRGAWCIRPDPRYKLMEAMCYLRFQDILAVQWLPLAMEESGVLPGVLTCCHALAHNTDRCVAPADKHDIHLPYACHWKSLSMLWELGCTRHPNAWSPYSRVQSAAIMVRSEAGAGAE